MAIRVASAADIDAIQEIAERSWKTDYPDILTRETASEAVTAWYNAAQLEAELGKARTLLLVAERDGTVAGFSHANWSDIESEGHILRIYVHPDHRREGIGSELLEETCATLATHGVDRIHAMVLTENDPGNTFYDRAGFEFVDERETTIGETTYPENRYVLEQPSDLDTD